MARGRKPRSFVDEKGTDLEQQANIKQDDVQETDKSVSEQPISETPITPKDKVVKSSSSQETIMKCFALAMTLDIKEKTELAKMILHSRVRR